MVVAGRPSANLQFKVLGRAKGWASLTQLVHPQTSPTIVCQAQLFALASGYSGEHTSLWPLLPRVGCDAAKAVVRKYARQQLLQSAAGACQIRRGAKQYAMSKSV